MPQPEAFTSFRMDAVPTQHSVPSCAWQLSRKKRKGSFDREKATLAGLSQEERKMLSEGVDVEQNTGQVFKASQFRGPSRPAISMAVKARYGLAVGSGKRISMRLPGADVAKGMRHEAERLRAE